MKLFISTLLRNILGCFKGRMLLRPAIAIAITGVLVASDCDWLYFRSVRNPILRSWMFPAAPIGELVPIALPVFLLVRGALGRVPNATLAGWAVGQAELIGALVAAA